MPTRSMLLAEAFTPAHRFVAVDLRGRGRSDQPADGYDVGSHAADALAVLDALSIARAVVGWSLGGRVALALAATAPERASG